MSEGDPVHPIAGDLLSGGPVVTSVRGVGPLLCVAAGLLLVACRASDEPSATVYRDANGVPHIVADDEEAAWYALGYENARDALFVVQKNVKLWTGHAAEYLGDEDDRPWLGDHFFRSDFISRVFQTDLAQRYAGDVEAGLAEMLGDEQFFRDLVAYARGLDDYRKRIADARGLDERELRMRRWLDDEDAAWVYTDRIGVEHVAAWGPFITSFAAFTMPQLDDPTPAAVAPVSPGGTRPRTGRVERDEAIEVVKALHAGLPGAGSNAFAWSFPYTHADERHTGHVADPQGWLIEDFVRPGGTSPRSVQVEPKFFAHVVVRSDDPIDVYGYLFSGSGMFFSFHNRDFALGGSASNANTADTFLLRLRSTAEDGVTGAPRVDESGEWSYYSYYADTDGDDGADDSDWVPLRRRQVSVRGASGADHTFELLDAGPFGIVPFARPFPVPNTRQWVLGGGANSIGTLGFEHVPAEGDDPGTIPCLVAYRIPGLPGVDDRAWGPETPWRERPWQPFHDRFATSEYRLLRAKSARDLQRELLRLDTSYAVNCLGADREGRIFVSRAAAIPRRGDDDLIAGLHELGVVPEEVERAAKLLAYQKHAGEREPVPARWYADRAWDWQFDGDRLEYLLPTGPGGEGEPGYLTYLVHDPVAGEFHPARDENPGFATASNDETAYTSNALAGPGNDLFGRAYHAGTTYASTSFAPALPKTAAFQARMRRIAGEIDPLLREESALELALSAREFVHPDYPGYETATGSVLVDGAAQLPVPVRVLYEMARDRATLDSIRAQAESERSMLASMPEPDAGLAALTLDDEEADTVVGLVGELVAWSAADFANGAESRPALLLEELELGLVAEGRLANWVFGRNRHASLMAEVGDQPIARVPAPPSSRGWGDAEPLLASRPRNLLRIQVLRTLLEADRFVRRELPPDAGFGDLVRARLFAADGTPRGPEGGIPCVGPGFRVVGRGPVDGGDAADAGFQRRLWALGGSANPLVTLFPHDRPDEPPRSFFWNVPGQRPADFASSHAVEMLRAYAENRPVTTYYSTYADPANHSRDPGLPRSPYAVP